MVCKQSTAPLERASLFHNVFSAVHLGDCHLLDHVINTLIGLAHETLTSVLEAKVVRAAYWDTGFHS